MRVLRTVIGGTLFLAVVLTGTPVHAGWSVGVRLNFPGYYGYYRPWGGYYYYPSYPVYVAPPPVYVAPPVVVQPAPVYQPVYPVPATAAPVTPAPRVAGPAAPAIAPVAAQTTSASSGEAQRLLQLLADPDDRVRADSVLQLGRMRAAQAVDPLAATLAGDRSPTVREAAARALGLIGSPRALAALQRAAQADPDRDVRHSSQFAIDVIQTGR
jgi:HEAT repeats